MYDAIKVGCYRVFRARHKLLAILSCVLVNWRFREEFYLALPVSATYRSGLVLFRLLVIFAEWLSWSYRRIKALECGRVFKALEYGIQVIRSRVYNHCHIWLKSSQ